LKGLIAGAAVVGFDPLQRSWITTASAATEAFPSFDGVLYTDAASLSAAADDFGHIIHRQPTAVLKPGSVNDIIKIVKFARRHQIKIAGRGQGHSTYGQPQVEAGVVIDMTSLSTIHAITASYADVDAGVVWSTLIQAALAQGLTPPTLTDYIELSVGGTLSVGGIGGTSSQHGVQADNVLELDVVTGEGKLETCSATHKRKLFNAVLGGLGQCGIIVRAKVKLIAADTQARVFLLYYNDIAIFTADQQTLVDDERFDYVEGQVIPNGTGGWSFMLEAAKFYSAPATPDNAALLAGLGHNAGTEQISDVSYFDFLNRLAPTIAFLKAIGIWGFPHPWSDIFIAEHAVNGYVSDVLANLTLDDTGQGPVLLYAFKTANMQRPLFRLPDTEHAFLFSILRTAPPVPEIVAAMVASNRALYEQNRDLGGTRYAIGAIPFSQADWQAHFGPVWNEFKKAKKDYDPDNILTPGQGIF
jgi:FAD/FMN-containing dehydrogenase